MVESQRIKVSSQRYNQSGSDLLAVCESHLPVKFLFDGTGQQDCCGEIIGSDFTGAIDSSVGNSVGRLVMFESKSTDSSGELKEIELRFADDSAVPFPFRARVLKGKVAAGFIPLEPAGGEKVLATVESKPVWTVSNTGGKVTFRTGFALPVLRPDKGLRDILNGERFFELLPLLHFIRTVAGGDAFVRPVLRACFMIDDPNLHRPTYGNVNYDEMARRAARGNYHVSFATVPLDSWFSSRATAQIFQQNSKYLSLLIHGNNHTHKELGGSYTHDERVTLLTQAISRIERLERKAKLPVSRVMAPPHGACSDDMLHDMPGCGCESATISHGSLRSFNNAKPWTRALGYLPSEIIRGCPVMPRWGFPGISKHPVLLACYLNQPRVLMGHHQDLKAGLESLDELADFINSLGVVEWSDMTQISRGNYLCQVTGNVLKVKPFARKLDLTIPGGVTNLHVEEEPRLGEAKWQISAGGRSVSEFTSNQQIPLSPGAGEKVAIALKLDGFVQKPNKYRRVQPWAIMRRLLTEGRDRFVD